MFGPGVKPNNSNGLYKECGLIFNDRHERGPQIAEAGDQMVCSWVWTDNNDKPITIVNKYHHSCWTANVINNKKPHMWTGIYPTDMHEIMSSTAPPPPPPPNPAVVREIFEEKQSCGNTYTKNINRKIMTISH